MIIEERNKSVEETNNTIYHVELDESNDNVRLLFEDKVVFEGVENKISIFKLLKALNIRADITKVEIPNLNSDDKY